MKLRYPRKILEAWQDDPERPVFLFDETRKALYNEHDELILFTSAVILAKDALELFHKLNEIRYENDLSESFKGHELRRDQARFGPLIGAICQARHRLLSIQFAVGRASIQKKVSKTMKVRFHLVPDETIKGRPGTVEGQELTPIVQLFKEQAVELELGDRQIDVIVDRSNSNGLGDKKRKLQPGVFEAFGPGTLNKGPNGPARFFCPSSFYFIADSDDGPFRNLLLLPDFYGYQLLYNSEEDVKAYLMNLSEETPYWRLAPRLSAIDKKNSGNPTHNA